MELDIEEEEEEEKRLFRVTWKNGSAGTDCITRYENLACEVEQWMDRRGSLDYFFNYDI